MEDKHAEFEKYLNAVAAGLAEGFGAAWAPVRKDPDAEQLTWRTVPPPRFYLVRADGLRIEIMDSRPGCGPRRLIADMSCVIEYPGGHAYPKPTPRITVAPETPAPKFAKAILSRLLPDCETQWARMQEEAASANAWEAKRAATVATLETAGVRFSTRHGSEPRPTSGGTGAPHYVSVRVGGERVTFDHLTVSVPAALAILETLKAHKD